MAKEGKILQIEGLRGLAIIFIILFHLFPDTFPMGFLGVEIFLVITGYLLFAKPFCKKDETVCQACSRFLGKKVKRIILPVAVLVVLSSLLGFFFLTPEDYAIGGMTGVTALFGGSNFYLNKAVSDYFSTDVSSCPLTHTWYLAVIIQIYLLYLAGNVIAKKWSVRAKCISLSVVAVASFIWFNMEPIQELVRMTGLEWRLSKPTYYGMPSRVWEVLAGAAIPFLPKPKCGNGRHACWAVSMLALIAVVALSLQCLWTDHFAPAICTVLCTMLIIRYAEGNVTHTIVTFKGLLGIGVISFSLYLVHFPIIVCYRSVEGVNTAPGVVIVAALILIVGYIFYRFVEIRNFGTRQGVILFCVALAACLPGIFSANAFLWRDTDFKPTTYNRNLRFAPASYSEAFDSSVLVPLYDVEKFTNHKEKLDSAMLMMGDGDVPTFFMMGDSHGAALFPGMDVFCAEHGLCGAYIKTYVVPFDGWRITRGWNVQRQAAMFRWLDAHPEIQTIVIGQYWQHRIGENPRFFCENGLYPDKTEALRQFLVQLKKRGKRVILIASVPGIESNNIIRDYRLSSRGDSFASHRAKLVSTIQDYDSEKKSSNDVLYEMETQGLCRVVSIRDACFDESGVFDGVKDGYKNMEDGNHLAPDGSIQILRRSAEQLLPLLNGQDAQ